MTHKIAVWVRIPRLPIELCNNSYLKRVGPFIGTMLKVDKRTSLHDRARFARICVEVNLENQLQTHITIRGEKFYLEFERLHAICFRCGKYGHKKDQCREFLGQVHDVQQNHELEVVTKENETCSMVVENSGMMMPLGEPLPEQQI